MDSSSSTDTDADTVFDPANQLVNLTTADPAAVICFLNSSQPNYSGPIGIRIASIFVILVISTLVTVFPVAAKRIPKLRIPLYVYLFARYFGAGVIISTAFIHLLDPSYAEIGPQTCVGMTGNWAQYSWPPAIILVSVMVIFLFDFGAERYVEIKYGITPQNVVATITTETEVNAPPHEHPVPVDGRNKRVELEIESDDGYSVEEKRSFRQQIAGFLILEFGVIFHSIVIGLNLGVTDADSFAVLFPVLVFHQSFEGLGIGARMSAIPFRKGSWLPWILCLLYGFVTPIAIAIGLGLRLQYDPDSFQANIASGVLDALSAGILIYTGLVELLARDFLFDPNRTQDNKRLTFMVICTLLGAGVMALLGKWA